MNFPEIGISTLVGSVPQIILVDVLRRFHEEEISFAEWFLFGFPLSLILLAFLWFFFSFIYLKKTKVSEFNLEKLQQEYEQLGAIKFEQVVVITSLTILALLWFLRTNIGPIPGWSRLFGGSSFVGDGTVAIAVIFILFWIPTETCHNQSDTDKGRAKSIMDWHVLNDLPWGILLLIGSGYALADAALAYLLFSLNCLHNLFSFFLAELDFPG